MKLAIKYGELTATNNFLFGVLAAKGLKLVHKKKLCSLLMEKIEKIRKEEIELTESYAEKDGKGVVIKEKKAGGEFYKLLPGKEEELREEKKKFFDEEFVVEGGNYYATLSAIKSLIKNCDLELTGMDGDVYANLYEQLIGLEDEGREE